MWQKIIDFLKGLFAPKVPAPVQKEIEAVPTVISSDVPLLPISWESVLGKDVSKFVYQTFLNNYDVIMSASDFDKIRSDYKDLGKAQLGTAFTEFISQIAKWESAWKVAAESVDVGHPDDRNTWSVGLMQMSQVDQKNYGLDLGYTYQDLKTAIPNLKLALAVLVKQIKTHGKIFISTSESGVYWATIHPGGKYDQTLAITYFTQAMKLQQFSKPEAPKVDPPKTDSDYFGAPWIGVRLDLLGLDETDSKLNAWLVPEWAKEGLPEFKTLAGNDHAWCSVYCNASMRAVGIKGTDDAMAASWRDWGVSCDYVFGATLGIRHASGGGHVTRFLYWTDKANRKAACLGGNQSNLFSVAEYNLSGNSSGHDEVINGPRAPKGWVGQSVSKADVLAKYPMLKVGGSGGSTQ